MEREKQYEKIRAEKMPEDISFQLFFRSRENFFQCFRTKFLSLLYMRSLAYKSSHCVSANCNPELRCVICTGVPLFTLVLHLNCTLLSVNQNRVIFSCVLLQVATIQP